MLILLHTDGHRWPFERVSQNQNQSNPNSQSEERKKNPKSQWELQVKTSKLTKARENAIDRVVMVLHLFAWKNDTIFFWTNHNAMQKFL